MKTKQKRAHLGTPSSSSAADSHPHGPSEFQAGRAGARRSQDASHSNESERAEDFYFSALAEKREYESKHRISHGNVW